MLGFDGFTLDRETGELWKHGEPIKLKPQPAQVLALLASRPGTVVSRDEIQQALWPDETYVDFDLGINSCIRQIRVALGDDTGAPRYIQTVSKRGYRFIARLDRKGIDEGHRAIEQGIAGDSNGKRGERRTTLRGVRPWLIAAFVLLATVFLGRRDTLREERTIRSEIAPPSGTRFHLQSANPGPPVLSPDGRKIAFSAREDAEDILLYVRALDATEARALPGTHGAQYPFWSPDSRFIGFFADGELKKIEATGGPGR